MQQKVWRKIKIILLVWLLVIGISQPANSYSVLTHQAIIDVAWEQSLEPLLKKRFPGLTTDELKLAHAHAYGGAIIQDMGYYPFGSKFFTDLVHYVRTGDFVEALLKESKTSNEYAFALGALAHYYADNYGHALATNKAVPLVYPKVKAKYGNVVTYEQDPVAHVKMELGFDVLQVARGNYAPESYQQFIGFEVSKEVLERAFQKTYSLELKSQFVSLDLAIGSYRKSVSSLIPGLTKVAWNMKANDIQKATPGITKRKFQYRISKAEYHKKWGTNYQKPNLWEKFLSYLFRVLPKVGPNRALGFKPPTPEAEKLFMQSFTTTVDNYTAGLKQVANNNLNLANTDFDTGKRTEAGDYKKADAAYNDLLKKLSKDDFKDVSPELRKHMVQYYSSPKPEIVKKEDIKDQEETQKLVKALQGKN